MQQIQKLVGSCAFALGLLGNALPVHAQAVPVTPDNFPRAETDSYFANLLKGGSLGKFKHNREAASVEKQTVIRMNRDTLYSFAIFDLEVGPATISLPDSGKRFMSLQVIDEDEYTHGVFYGTTAHTFTKNDIGTRYLCFLVRTLVNPERAGDLEEVHNLQNAIKVEQTGGPGKFEVPDWDAVSHKKVRDALLALAPTLKSFEAAFGSKSEVNPVHYLIGAAAGWGGNPDKEAVYRSVNPKEDDGKTIYRLHVPADVPVDGFWSVSRYSAKGFFVPNKLNAYSINNFTATKASDGSVEIQFGGCDGKIPNCLPIEAGWNYTVRMYRPRPEVLDGKWLFPEAQPVS
jgi:hypothetical protein